jgi:hypothetical protein
VKQYPSREDGSSSVIQDILPTFMEGEGSLQCSQEPATERYLELTKSSTRPQILLT